VDLGGTNFRVCSVTLNGDSTFSLEQSKYAIPKALMTSTSHELFSHLAQHIADFIDTHHREHAPDQKLALGFTFSFPVTQKAINHGTLLRWTKGYDIKDAIGKDVCALLQTELDALNLPIKVAALVNDTVGTLMARSYTAPGTAGTLIGAIFGTGTNGAYVEKLPKISKMTAPGNDFGSYDDSTGEMVINTEWGSFDNDLKVLPNTPYDKALDEVSVNPGIQMFEKRVSGMFLGEILRQALVVLQREADLFISADVPYNAPLYSAWAVDSAVLSHIQTGDIPRTQQLIKHNFGVVDSSEQDAIAVKIIVEAIGRRSARLAAVPIAAIVLQSGKLGMGKQALDLAPEPIDVGVDGSLVEHYPGFEEYLREALREVTEVGMLGEKRITMGIAKDGSGVGAALIALVAAKSGIV